MKIAISASLFLGFMLGFATHVVFFDRSSAKYHWKEVNRYNAYMNNPANAQPATVVGLGVMTPPLDPEPHLAALVAGGELQNVDLVLPTVPKTSEANKHWMRFGNAHPEIVYALGNPEYVDFKPAGTQPLHLRMWVRMQDIGSLQTLIRELEAKFGTNTKAE